MSDQSLSSLPLGSALPANPPSVNSLPFSGLGFDLTTVCDAGAACRLVEVRQGTVLQAANVFPWFSRSAGYALLLNLGREIRGR